MTERAFPKPPAWRIIAAFLIAPAAAAVAYAAVGVALTEPPHLDLIVKASGFYLYGAYPSALIFGVPALFVLRNRVRPTATNCALTGAIIASLPWLLLSLLPGADYAEIGSHVTTLHGHLTIWGWIEGAVFLGQVGAAGAFGGFVFWLVAVAGFKPPRPEVSPS